MGTAPGLLSPASCSPQRVLTADFCAGCKVNDVEAIRSQGLAVKDVSAGAGRGGAGGRYVRCKVSPLPR